MNHIRLNELADQLKRERDKADYELDAHIARCIGCAQCNELAATADMARQRMKRFQRECRR